MPVGTRRRLLGYGRTVGLVKVPLRVGSTGSIGGSGEPIGDETGAMPQKLLYGRTVGGLNVPLRVDADGDPQIDWNP